MSLASNLSDAFTRIGTEFKSIRTLISGSGTGDVSGLTTTANDLVAAINEVKTTADNAATGVPDADEISIADAGGLYSATNVEAALAEVRGVADAAAGGGISINDAATNASQAWSSQKIDQEITDAVNALVDGAPGALNTLNELAAAVDDNASFASSVTSALGNRLRVDSAQGLSSPQQLQGCQNLGVGDPTTNFQTTFESALL